MAEEEEVAAEEPNVQAYMEGLSRLDRVVDDSGFAFTALDVVVRSGAVREMYLHGVTTDRSLARSAL